VLLSYHDARARAVRRALDTDPELLLIGSDIAYPFNPEFGLQEDYAERIMVPPISEFASLAAGVGAAIAGQRVLLPITTSSFAFHGWAAIVQEAANVRFLSAGQSTAPLTIHLQSGARRSGGAQHEHTPQSMLQNVPGLRIYQPGTPAEIDAVFAAALNAEDPTLIFDHVLLIDSVGDVDPVPANPDTPYFVRHGSDVLIVASGLMVQRALQAAAVLETDGVSVAVLSNPLISPAPDEAVLAAAQRFERVMFVDESRGPASPASYLMARMLEAGCTARVRLVCTGFAPSPFALALLDSLVPTIERIATSARALVGLSGPVGDLS
jgi:pyruvate/2-oxoglutarate/acetoin dehydrogenase E1 component